MANLLAPAIALLLKKSNNYVVNEELAWSELVEHISNTSLPSTHPLKLISDGFRTNTAASQLIWKSSLVCLEYMGTDRKISLVQDLLRRYTVDTGSYAAKACTFKSQLKLSCRTLLAANPSQACHFAQ